VLSGLQAQPSVNGQPVIIVQYLPAEGRYRVQPAEPGSSPLPPTLAVRPHNLVPAGGNGRPSPRHGRRSLLHPFGKQSKSVSHDIAAPHMQQQRRQSIPHIPAMISVEADYNESWGLESFSQAGPASVTHQPLAPHSTAVLHSLKTQPALNGQMVVVEEYLADQGRYRVTPIDPTVTSMPVLAIKPANLLACTDPRGSMTVAPSAVSDSTWGHSTTASSTSGSGSHGGGGGGGANHGNGNSNPFFKDGSRARLVDLQNQPSLNGIMVRIVEYSPTENRYRVVPIDVEAMDACETDILAIRPQNLRSEDPLPDGSDPLPAGTRAVLANLVGMPALNGQLVAIERYLPEQGMYEVRPLGQEASRAAPARVLIIKPSNIKEAPQSAFWVRMTIKGKSLRLPVSCKVTRDRMGQAHVSVLLDPFPGLDEVIPVAKVVLGEDFCDWMNDGEVLPALAASKSQQITHDIADRRAFSGLRRDEAFIAKGKQPPIFEAMVDFELIKPTEKLVDVEMLGTLSVYKLLFPDIPEKKYLMSLSGHGDDADKPERPSMKNPKSASRSSSSRSLHSSTSKKEHGSESLGKKSKSSRSLVSAESRRRGSRDSGRPKVEDSDRHQSLGKKSKSSRSVMSAGSSRRGSRDSGRSKVEDRHRSPGKKSKSSRSVMSDDSDGNGSQDGGQSMAEDRHRSSKSSRSVMSDDSDGDGSQDSGRSMAEDRHRSSNSSRSVMSDDNDGDGSRDDGRSRLEDRNRHRSSKSSRSIMSDDSDRDGSRDGGRSIAEDRDNSRREKKPPLHIGASTEHVRSSRSRPSSSKSHSGSRPHAQRRAKSERHLKLDPPPDPPGTTDVPVIRRASRRNCGGTDPVGHLSFSNLPHTDTMSYVSGQQHHQPPAYQAPIPVAYTSNRLSSSFSSFASEMSDNDDDDDDDDDEDEDDDGSMSFNNALRGGGRAKSKSAKSQSAKSKSGKSELDMQDLFSNIEKREAEKDELNRSIKTLDKRLSLVQATCDAASRKLKLLRGENEGA